MGLHFFTIPVHSLRESEAELNRFLSQHKVVGIEKHFVMDRADSFWAVCVSTAHVQEELNTPGKKSSRSRIDYKETLSPENFAIYAKLRQLRKEIAEAEGIPAYAVFTNAQLAKLVTDNIQTRTGLQTVEGVGQSRIEKYGERFLTYLERCKKRELPSDVS